MNLKNNGNQLKRLRDKKAKLLKQRDLSMKSRMAAQEQSAQEQSGEFNPNYYYDVVELTEVRVDGIPGTSLGIIERETNKCVGEIEHGMFKNYGIPDAEWNGKTLEIGGKVFLKCI